MNDKEFLDMYNAIAMAAKRYPNCRIAACDCNSKGTEWKKDCNCLCHFYHMDIKYGEDKWTMNDFSEQTKIGLK
jgi:hypothetical protein